MPVVVAEAIAVLWPALAAALGTTGVAALSYAIVVSAFYAYGTYQSRAARQAARSSFNDSLKDRLVMTATTDAPRSRIYGRCRNVDGILFKNTHGPKKEYYTFFVAMAGHEVNAATEPNKGSW